MFNSDDWDDDFFKDNSRWDHHWAAGGGGAMDIVIGIACVVGLAVLLALICRCCRTTKYRGRVLQPPPDASVSAGAGPPAPYPQQQYSTVTVSAVPVGSPYPTGVSYPTAGAPYPGAGGPYPGAGAPYPGAGAPYPAVSPYPAAGYPGAHAAPYPSAMPQPHASSAPSAPDAHAFIGIAPPGWHTQALPPSYDQVMGREGKPPPFNPHPH